MLEFLEKAFDKFSRAMCLEKSLVGHILIWYPRVSSRSLITGSSSAGNEEETNSILGSICDFPSDLDS